MTTALVDCDICGATHTADPAAWDRRLYQYYPREELMCLVSCCLYCDSFIATPLCTRCQQDLPTVDDWCAACFDEMENDDE